MNTCISVFTSTFKHIIFRKNEGHKNEGQCCTLHSLQLFLQCSCPHAVLAYNIHTEASRA